MAKDEILEMEPEELDWAFGIDGQNGGPVRLVTDPDPETALFALGRALAQRPELRRYLARLLAGSSDEETGPRM